MMAMIRLGGRLERCPRLDILLYLATTSLFVAFVKEHSMSLKLADNYLEGQTNLHASQGIALKLEPHLLWSDGSINMTASYSGFDRSWTEP